jgi:ATP-dependent helicase HrpB
LPARAIPELLESDLTPLALELACAGIADASDLRWLDAPPAGALAQGRALLRDLGAMDAAGRVTAHGRAMAALGIAPRLAHLVLMGAARGEAVLACDVAALLAERDILRRDAAEVDADLRTRVEALRGDLRGLADGARVQRVRAEAKALRQSLPRELRDRAPSAADDDPLGTLGLLVALAYPDRLARRRAGEAPRYQLRNGRGARFALPQPLGHAPFLAIADLDGDPAESRIWLAAPLSETDLRDAAGPALVTEQVVGWDDDADEVIAVERERLGAIILRERPLRTVEADAIATALAASVKRRGLDALTWNDAALALRRRLAFAHRVEPATYADVSDAALLDSLEEWLLPALHGVRRRAELARVDLGAALLARVEWGARARLDRLAPTHLEVPSGSRIAIDYSDAAQPVLAVKLQEVFGLLDTPRIGEGRVPITMHLLSPAGRPVQVTRDLASFWRAGYFEVKKDLKGRYPRHPWPDDPLVAPPTRRVKPRGT